MMRQRGFTLVELSIVLVVIGLIIGGIMLGQDLVVGGKLTRVTADVARFRTAFNSFETRYGSPPGDFEKATDYWGTNGVCPNGTGTTGGTCNGNGDGHVGVTDTNSSVCTESFFAWRHLALSGFLPGQFSGALPGGTTGNWCATRAGENAPLSPLGQGGAYMWWGSASPMTWWNNYFLDFTENVVMLGSTKNGTDGAVSPAMTASDASNIDLKMDDGLPGYGKVQGPTATNWYSPGCTTTNAASTARYVSGEEAIICALVFRP